MNCSMVSDVLESTRVEESHLTETMENFEGVPMLEICERPLVWTGEEPPSMLQAYKGTVKHCHQGAPLAMLQAYKGTIKHCHQGEPLAMLQAYKGTIKHCHQGAPLAMLQAYKGTI